MSLSAATRLGTHEVVAPIGAGGMGEVYRARDSRLGREVAIKILPAAFAQDPERLARFEREARLLASLNHPNIAQIYGFERAVLDDGGTVHFLAMELVEGEDLSQRLKSGPVPVDEAIAIARQIAEALEEAHEKGIVHRDLKPANIKLTPDGRVKVLDFGLAKAYTTDAEASGSSELSHSPTMTRQGTEAGMILGTAAYMSPEQARGKTVDRRADIWAFGVVCFEMLTGERLFAGETVSDTLAAVLRQDVDWTLLPESLSARHRRLIERCLVRDPRKRLRDIGEARLALDEQGERLEPAAVAGSAAIPTATPGRSVRLLAAVAALAFAVGWFSGSRMGRPAPRPAGGIKVAPITSSGTVISATISPDGRFVAYVESDQGRQSLWLKQLSSGQTLRLIPEQNVAYWSHTFTPDGNNIVFGQKSNADPDGALYSISTLGGAPRRLLTGMDSAPSFSPDGKRFTYTRLRYPADDETALMTASADGTDPAVLARFKRPERVAGIFFGGPAWSPDGTTIVTALVRSASAGQTAQARLIAVAVDGGAVTPVADPGWVFVAQAGFLPDGKSLLVIASAVDQDQSQIWSVSYPDGTATRLTSDVNDHRIISLTRDGRSLVSVSGQLSSTVWTMPLRGPGKLSRVSRSTMDGVNGLVFTPAGKLVYTSYVGGVWSLWSARPDGSERNSFFTANPDDSILSPRVTSDGSVYYADRTPSGSHIRAVSPDGASSRTIASDVAFDTFGVSPDGSSLVFDALVKGINHLFSLPAPGGERTQLLDHIAFTPALDKSGRRMAFYFINSENQYRIGVRAVDGGPLLADLPAEPSSANTRLLLTDDGVYANTMPGDRANVWLLPTDGRPPRQVTSFEDQLIFDFAISPDGSTLAIARGPRLRDAQLITGFD